jgi:hypothetical protein
VCGSDRSPTTLAATLFREPWHVASVERHSCSDAFSSVLTAVSPARTMPSALDRPRSVTIGSAGAVRSAVITRVVAGVVAVSFGVVVSASVRRPTSKRSPSTIVPLVRIAMKWVYKPSFSAGTAEGDIVSVAAHTASGGR